MTFRLYDTATNEVRPLEMKEPGKLGIYVCGPTVYDLPHVGHGRAVLTYDLLRRYLTYRGVEINHVSNITDIEDKIISRAKQLGISTTDLTSRYEKEWFAAMDRLGVLRPHSTPHATEFVDEMVSMISELIDKGVAYETSSSIYLSTDKVDGYGLLARQSLESLQAGARVASDDEKKSPTDFALWKKVDASVDEPVWDSPWGTGRPGWHSECVVMSLNILGEGFDLHAGGLDLCFPHHENERAQSVAWGREFARHWMHNGFVEVDGEKMSKSLGNFTSLVDLLDRHDKRAYRLLLLRSHYRSPVEVTQSAIVDAEAALARIDEFARRAGSTSRDGVSRVVLSAAAQLRDDFIEFMDNDLDSPSALALLFGAIREANGFFDNGQTNEALALSDVIFELFEAVGVTAKVDEREIDPQTAELINRRDLARANKDWAVADRLRDELIEIGWTVEDTPEGTKVH